MAPDMDTATSKRLLAEDKGGEGKPLGEHLIVKYRQNYYDITKFLKKHPGGVNTLKGLSNADMTARFLKAPPHSDEAMYLMQEYKITPPPTTKTNGHAVDKAARTEKTSENGIELLANGKHTAQQQQQQLEEDKNNNQLDESMEHLVDWNRAMVLQIPKITKHYDEWVHKPVDRPLRLFEPWYLEICTKTPWWVIPVFWIPVILTLLQEEFLLSWRTDANRSLLSFVLYFLGGVLLWTLLEYSLHRWVFHMKTDGNTNPWLCTFHFVIHGLHHKVPFDPLRLVFPPLPGALLATVLYTPLSFIMPLPRIWLGGALLGYMCYDLMHYYLHYGNPSMPHMYHMKRYHYQHHFTHQDLGYGISSPLWDFVFNTRIHLRKLKFKLRWD